MTSSLATSLSLLHPSLPSTVAQARLLVVGAGGIGCELLKNLVLSGFTHMHIIDMDEIDVSNLNRQLLFRRSDVGHSKAMAAARAIQTFAQAEGAPSSSSSSSSSSAASSSASSGGLDVVAHHGNIKESRFGPAFFCQFDLVLNALDNVEARRHVNRMCLATKTRLIESGTQGYLGQVSPILAGATECFECHPPAAQKTYAVCTIRNTPDKPVHCIVWAKAVYDAMFGPPDEGNIMSDSQALLDVEAAKRDPRAFAASVFRKFFEADIEAAASVAERWVVRTPPTPQRLAELADEPDDAFLAGFHRRDHDQRVLSARECALAFLDTVVRLVETRHGDFGSLTFDKDDELSMDFVATSANLRMYAYGIAPASAFAAKGIAGNIVHAIASTNAICAGLIVMEALKLLATEGLRKPLEEWAPSKAPSHPTLPARTVWIRRHDTLLQCQTMCGPAEGCVVCSGQQVVVYVDVNRSTVQDLFERVCMAGLRMGDPSILVQSTEKYIGLQEDFEDHLDKPLSAPIVGIIDYTLLLVEDYDVEDDTEYRVQVLVRHRDMERGQFDVKGSAAPTKLPPKPEEPPAAPSSSSAAAAAAQPTEVVVLDAQDEDEDGDTAMNGNGNDDTVLLLSDSDDEPAPVPSTGTKRKAGEDGSGASNGDANARPRKRARDADEDDDVVMIG